jgi:signal transduction histidine kinase
MSPWWQGKRGATFAYVFVAALVLSGLGWLTATALRLERDGQLAQAQAQEFEKLRLALWRLDSTLAPVLAREDSRPFQDYSEMFAPVALLQADGTSLSPGRVFEPSPLLTDELPDWMLLHFQVDAQGNWKSPQVFPDALARRMANSAPPVSLLNRTAERTELLAALTRQLPARELVALVQTQSGILTRQNLMLLANTADQNTIQFNAQATQSLMPNAEFDRELRNRAMRQVQNSTLNPRKDANQGTNSKSGNYFLDQENKPAEQTKTPNQSALKKNPGRIVSVTVGPMTPFWKQVGAQPERLFMMRTGRIEEAEVCQGVLLDWPRLETILREEVQDLFPNVTFSRATEGQPLQPDRTLASLPVLLNPGASVAPEAEARWSALRLGLILAWTAALIALLAVWLGGWSLLELSERRFRFVSAVTHELRTPLTTLRLYLDMLAGGLIREEKQQAEYLQTLNVEADRLNRLVGNVLDFSCLENQKPRLVLADAGVRELFEEASQSWHSRCHDAGMELSIEPSPELEQTLTTDSRLVQQILGILIDNACKYCREAKDRRIWLRARPAGIGKLALEVEDRGPGIPLLERRSIFRAFKRGKNTEVITGGVGLGLALAERWARLLGGRLFLKTPPNSTGACFRLEIPS